MSNPIAILPTTRSWKDIPQAVNSRAIPRWGRWRRLVAALGVAGMVLTVVGVLAGVWMVTNELSGKGASPAAGANARPLKTLELITDGTLDHEWLVRILNFSKQTTLEDLKLKQLRAQLMAEGQVLSANLRVKLPGTLVVQITERTPMARVMAQLGGRSTPLLVARDGVAFDGVGYDPRMTDLLPWLGGIALTRQGGAFKPIAGMDVVSDLLAKAQLEAEHLYRTWHVVSLERLEFDQEIEVRTRAPQGATIVFSAGDDFFRQLGKLNTIWE
ncbi:MAG: hypothetical protein ABIZ49_06460, partial [Opitutaceae bacterium]